MDRLYHCLSLDPRKPSFQSLRRELSTMELVPASSWGHVVNQDNPADCASWGIFPSELIHNDLWWNGPPWLKLPPPKWPKNNLLANVTHEVAKELNTTTTCNLAVIKDPLTPVDKFSSFNNIMYKWVIAWIIRFIHNCRSKVKATQPRSGPLSTDEISLLVLPHPKDTPPWRAENSGYKVLEDSHIKQAFLSQSTCWWPRDTESWWETTPCK